MEAWTVVLLLLQFPTVAGPTHPACVYTDQNTDQNCQRTETLFRPYVPSGVKRRSLSWKRVQNRTVIEPNLIYLRCSCPGNGHVCCFKDVGQEIAFLCKILLNKPPIHSVQNEFKQTTTSEQTEVTVTPWDLHQPLISDTVALLNLSGCSWGQTGLKRKIPFQFGCFLGMQKQ